MSLRWTSGTRRLPRIDEEFDRATVLSRRARLAVGGDVFVEEAPPQLAHGGRLGVLPACRRRVLPGPGVGDDLGCPRAGFGRRYGPVGPDGDLDGAPAPAGLDDVDLAAGGMDAPSPAACAIALHEPNEERTSQVSIVDLAKRSFLLHDAGRIRCVSPIPQPPEGAGLPEATAEMYRGDLRQFALPAPATRLERRSSR